MPRMNQARIGLLGGSFNPAHAGHLHISRMALRMLGLDEVWWLVSPQNPLKSSDGMGSLDQRLKTASEVARPEPRILVTDLEADLGTQYTSDTLVELKRSFPNVSFVWLMGADNLLQMHHWKQWTRIFNTVPIAVFGRPGYSYRATSSVVARRFARDRWPRAAANRLVDAAAPAWVFLKIREHPESATRIRENGDGDHSHSNVRLTVPLPT